MAKGFIGAKIKGDKCAVRIKGKIGEREALAATLGIFISASKFLSMKPSVLAKILYDATVVREIQENDKEEMTEGEEND